MPQTSSNDHLKLLSMLSLLTIILRFSFNVLSLDSFLLDHIAPKHLPPLTSVDFPEHPNDLETLEWAVQAESRWRDWFTDDPAFFSHLHLPTMILISLSNFLYFQCFTVSLSAPSLLMNLKNWWQVINPGKKVVVGTCVCVFVCVWVCDTYDACLCVVCAHMGAVCVHVSLGIWMYLCESAHVGVLVCSIHVNMCMIVAVHKYVCMCEYECVYMTCVYEYVSYMHVCGLHVCGHEYIWACMWISCVLVCAHVCESMCMWVCSCVGVCMVHVHVSGCMCVCVCVCVCRPDSWSLGVKQWKNLFPPRHIYSYEELLSWLGEFPFWWLLLSPSLVPSSPSLPLWFCQWFWPLLSSISNTSSAFQEHMVWTLLCLLWPWDLHPMACPFRGHFSVSTMGCYTAFLMGLKGRFNELREWSVGFQDGVSIQYLEAIIIINVCVTLGKWLSHPEPQFLYLGNGDNISHLLVSLWKYGKTPL